MVRKILETIPDEQLQKSLEKYRQRALELGATDAKVITSAMVLVDERVRAKCLYPKCRRYGTNAHCPPYAPDLELVRKIVNNFHYAVFIKLEVPSEEMAGPQARDKRLSTRSQMKIYEVVGKIEAEAFYNGYHLAVGFAGGPCNIFFCPDQECSALIPGQGCRHPLKARGSMEGVGMDVFTMATRVGWDIYPIGASVSPSEVLHGTALGLVLIY